MFAYIALHRLKILPQELYNMDQRHKAFIYGCIEKYIEDEKRK